TKETRDLKIRSAASCREWRQSRNPETLGKIIRPGCEGIRSGVVCKRMTQPEFVDQIWPNHPAMIARDVCHAGYKWSHSQLDVVTGRTVGTRVREVLLAVPKEDFMSGIDDVIQPPVVTILDVVATEIRREIGTGNRNI